MIDKIRDYYAKRGLVWPKTVWEALGWAHTELGEVYELLLFRQRKWIRNNPSEHSEFTPERLAEELSDVLMMVAVTGIIEGVDVFKALEDKLNV